MVDNPSIEVQQDYYNSYWRERSKILNPHELCRLGEIFNALAVVREDARLRNINLQICDFGSGWGWLSNFLSYVGDVVGVELSNAAVSDAKQQFPHVEFVCSDITQWRPQRTFDLVVSSEVVEHVPDKAAFFETIDTILRPGGWVILTTPNRAVKTGWDAQNGTSQIIEEWCSVPELRQFCGAYKIVTHYTFFPDFSYRGVFRVLSAPKLLNTLNMLKLLSIYNALRRKMNLGLYQIIVAQKPLQANR
jgi:2-polyprenyl-3-methyl-5-hydroxy-6-metoxy-1,4-benzoquinol methylase